MEKGHPLSDIKPIENNHNFNATPKKKNNIKRSAIISVILFFMVIFYVVGMKVVRARVIITEKNIPFNVENLELELTHENIAGEGRLSFQTMVVPTTVTRQVFGSEIQPVNSTAKGKVVFFNEYSKGSQTVRAKTTITGANGKKYQTQTTVTVPGYTTVAGKKVPGTSSPVVISAIEVGSNYNTNGTTFTVAGWTGTRSKLFYAQSAGAITGGEQGNMHTVTDEEKPGVITTLNTQLIERLKRETRAQIPSDYITYPDLQLTTIDTDSLHLRGTSIRFPASIEGTMITYLISRDMLEAAIASKIVQDRSYSDVSVVGLGSLSVIPITHIPTDPKIIPDSIKISITGKGSILTKPPVQTIKQNLTGRSKKDFTQILGEIPEVDMAEYRFYPFWAPFFPTNENRIKIIVE